MPFGPLEDTVLTTEAPGSSSSRFRPYASPNHHVVKSRYITSNDPRGYIPVYEYPLNGQWIMMDVDDGYVLWTGIWKALGNSKADIVKMVESQPDLASQIRRVRGGYLKIQGTWMPYEVALRLARRVAWTIRHDLVPLFGPTFPSTCLSPDQAGYGQVIPTASNRRRPRRSNAQTSVFTSSGVPEGSSGWTIVNYCPSPTSPRWVPEDTAVEHHSQRLSPFAGPSGGPTRSPTVRHARYTPYPEPLPPPLPSTVLGKHPQPPFTPSTAAPLSRVDAITLPPVRDPVAKPSATSVVALALPPISSLAEAKAGDVRAVLERLRAGDEPSSPSSIAYHSERHMSLDEHMQRRSQALLASSRPEAGNSLWSESRLSADRHSCLHVEMIHAYETSSSGSTPFERSPISPVTPPHAHTLPTLSVFKGRHGRDSRSLEPQAYPW